ncbi:MAG: hypothetical protein KDB27_25760, partial [Planctomycetales bacterium]|nr:hypothetical protein [Planctomycetales bacterium]
RADGRGSSLERVASTNDPSRPGSWQPSGSFHGSPGAENTAVASAIVINEVLPQNASNNVARVELLNTSGEVQTFDGYITNGPRDPLRHRVAPVEIDANAFLVLSSPDFAFDFNADSSDEVWLIASDASGRPTYFADVVEFPATPVGSRGRIPDGTGNFILLSTSTPGATNAAPPVDFNGDAVLDDSDLDHLCQAIAAHSADKLFDVNGDSTVDFADMRYMVEVIFQTTFGDANLDQRFDSRDLVEIFTAREFEDGIPGNSTWAEGDWDCDGDMTTRDLVLAFQSGRYAQFAQSQQNIAAWYNHDRLKETEMAQKRTARVR